MPNTDWKCKAIASSISSCVLQMLPLPSFSRRMLFCLFLPLASMWKYFVLASPSAR